MSQRDALEHEAGEGDEVQAGDGLGQSLVVAHEASEAGGPGEGALNGLIANDKFCLTRALRLRLGWPRARGRLRTRNPAQLPGEFAYRGEGHAAAAQLAGPAHGRADGDRPAAPGPGIQASPAVGDDTAASSDRGAGGGNPAGDVPCA